jgi:hypothetical protein
MDCVAPCSTSLKTDTGRLSREVGRAVAAKREDGQSSRPHPALALFHDRRRAVRDDQARRSRGHTQSDLNVVVNWQEELKQRVPTR